MWEVGLNFLLPSQFSAPATWELGSSTSQSHTRHQAPQFSSVVLMDPCFRLSFWPGMARILELGPPCKAGTGFHSRPTLVGIV